MFIVFNGSSKAADTSKYVTSDFLLHFVESVTGDRKVQVQVSAKSAVFIVVMHFMHY